MPNLFIFRPLQANLIHNKENIGLMDPYCKIKLGYHTAKTVVAQSAGQHPHWEDILKLKRKHGETFCKVKVKDRDRFSFNDPLGEAKIDLQEAMAKGKVLEWINIYRHGRLAGEILIEITYQPELKNATS